MAEHGAESAAGCTGLRERKKRRTRDALVLAALRRFTVQGYDRTTVDEIADDVEVSQRTFFRYFASKEAVAFAVQDVAESHLFAAFCARPPEESPVPALRNAITSSWDRISEAILQVVPQELHMRMYQVIESTPALLAEHLRRSTELEERLACELARREGLDVDGDPRPRVLVAMFSGVMRTTGRVWGSGEDFTVDALRELTESHLDQIGPALAESWRPRAQRGSPVPTRNAGP